MSDERWSAHEALAEALAADAEADPSAFGVEAEEARDLAAALSALRAAAAPDDEGDAPVRRQELPAVHERIGNYELLERLGVGGFAAVYRAHDPVLDVDVAIKLVTVPPGAQDEVRERFEREARTVARLEHRHVVRVRAAGVDDRRPYLVLDLVGGDSLQTIVDRDGPLDPLRAAAIARDLADALAAAHAEGILHRDLKPDNVLLGADGVARLTDFGLALDALAEGDQRLTQEGHYLGTPGYWPPEQARGDLSAISERSDVYGLGATLYALLTGRPPFVGRSVLATLESMSRAFPRPSALAEVPRGLEAICLRCLEREPAARYASAEALRDDLDAWLADPDFVPRRRRPLLLGAAVLSVLAVGAAAWIFRASPPPAPTAEASTRPLPPPPALGIAPTASTATPRSTPRAAPGWLERAPAGARPAPRSGAAFAYDSVRRRALLFGGTGLRGPLDDLWAWDGDRWTLLSRGRGPPPRAGAAAAFDAARGRLILVGGRVRKRRGRRKPDLWEYDGRDWTELTPPARLRKRRSLQLVYDARRRVTVLLSQRQVWEWDGARWRSGAPAPAARGPLAWDPTRARTLQLDAASGALWAYDGRAWRLTAHPPPTANRGFHLLGVRVGVMLARSPDALWLLRSGRWTPLALPGPPPRSGGALTWDAARERVLLFGGVGEQRRIYGDLWELTLPD